MTGIIAYGAYVPRLRLQRSAIYQANAWFAPGLKSLGQGERAMANWDEDSITMAVEAARDALGSRDRRDIAGLTLASTSAPFADRQNAGIVKEALDLPDAIETMDVGGSLKAGTGALLQALRAAGARDASILCVAADKRRAKPASEFELSVGDGAAAFLVGAARPIARLLGSYSTSLDFIDHFRGAGATFDYAWESRWVRDEGHVKIAGAAIAAALDALGCPGASIAHLIIPIVTPGVAQRLARQVAVDAQAVHDTRLATIGDTGCAHPLLLLADVLDDAKPHERILVLGFGQGADVLLLEVTEEILRAPRPRGVAGWIARRKEETNYLKYLAFAGNLLLDRGMRAEFDHKQPLTSLFRNRRSVLGLVGGRSARTGSVQYPKTQISVDPRDDAIGALEDYPLADRRARILTYTADNLGYTPDPPGYYGAIEFDGGGRMVCEFTDVDPAAVEVGSPMRMMFRIKAVDERRDFIKYFRKAVPADQPD